MLNFKKNTQAQKGVTLIELIVVTAIIAILSGIFFINYRNSQQGYTLDLAARELVSNIRWAQNAAMSGLEQSTSINVYGYGVHINSDGLGYAVFYNKISQGTTWINSDNDIRTITLSDLITIMSGQDESIFFVPPDPTTFISAGSSVNITLRKDGSTETETVTVYESGLIEY